MLRSVLALLVLLAASGCTAAYKSDAASDALSDACANIATTGDFYRHCMEVGPDAALRERPVLISANRAE